jgi:hypothetical protein
MRLAHAVLAGLVAGGIAGWWALGHPGYETAEQKLRRLEAHEQARQPALYRWRDDKGVLHLTDTPPKGRKYEKVALREDLNIIPMAPEKPPPGQEAAPEK